MADANFTIDLALENADDLPQARGELDRLRSSLERNTATLAKMQAAYRNLKVGGRVNSEQAKELKARIDAAKKSIGNAQASLLEMKGGLAGTTAASRGTSQAMAGLISGAKVASGRFGGMAASASGVASRLGVAGLATAALSVAAVGAVAAVIALDAAIVKTTADLAIYGVKAADAYRSERLALEGMTQAYRGWWFQRPVGKASEVQAAIDGVSGSVSIGRDKVNQYAQSLYRAGLRGDNLKRGLEGVALAASAAGDEYGAQAQDMVASAALFGKSVKGMTDVFKSRFGSIVERQMLSLPVQLAKSREGFNALFRGLKIEPVLRGLDRVLGVTRTSSVEFAAWKQIFESLFNPLASGAEDAGSTIKEFVDGVTIQALRATIAWERLKTSATLRDDGLRTFRTSLADVVKGTSDFAIGVLTAAQGIIIMGKVAANTFQAVYNLTKLVGAPLAMLGGTVSDAKRAQREAIDGLADAGEGLANTSGSRLIEGLIQGIRAAQPGLIAAARDAAKGANKAFATEQQIHSPSRKWREFGRHMGGGLTLGVKDSTPRVEEAVGAMAEAPAKAPARAGGRSVEVHVPVTIEIQGGSSAPTGLDLGLLRTEVAKIFEGIVLQMAGRL